MGDSDVDIGHFFKTVLGKNHKFKIKDKLYKDGDEEVAQVYLSREQEAKNFFGSDASKLVSPDTECVLVSSLEQAYSVIAECKGAKKAFLDVETTGFDPHTDQCVSLQLSPRAKISYYFPFAHKDFSGNLPFLPIMSSVATELFLDPDVVVGGHNIKFDLKWWLVLGLPMPLNHRDTMVQAFVIDVNRSDLGLKELVAQIFKVKMISFKDLGIHEKGKKLRPGQLLDFSYLPVLKALEYACADSDYSLRLDEYFYPQIEADSIKYVYNNIDELLVPVLARMELKGMHIDIEYLKSLISPFEEKVAADIKELRQIAEKVGFSNPPDKAGVIEPYNPNSNPQNVAVIKAMNMTTGKYSKKTKNMSVDKEVIEKFASTVPFFRFLDDLRKTEKTLGTYIIPLVEEHCNPKTGRVHTSFNQTVAATGRLSSSSPNLQNLPKRYGLVVRRAFIPAFGYRFIRADYSQIELKILAHLSKCKAFIDAFLRGDDIHSMVAIKAFKLTCTPAELKVSAELSHYRNKAKIINFGIVYGITSKGLSRQIGCSQEEAQGLINSFFAAFPEVKRWLGECVKKLYRDGYVETMLRRKRAFVKDPTTKEFRFGAERAAQNHPIQGSNADMTKHAMNNIERRLREEKWDAVLVCQIHDELIIECKEDQIDAVAEIVVFEMEKGLSSFGEARARRDNQPNQFQLVTGSSVEFEIQKAWGVEVCKCPNCNKWSSEFVNIEKTQLKCGDCSAVYCG